MKFKIEVHFPTAPRDIRSERMCKLKRLMGYANCCANTTQSYRGKGESVREADEGTEMRMKAFSINNSTSSKGTDLISTEHNRMKSSESGTAKKVKAHAACAAYFYYENISFFSCFCFCFGFGLIYCHTIPGGWLGWQISMRIALSGMNYMLEITVVSLL